MSIKIGTSSVNTITYENADVKKVILDGSTVWCKPFTYSQGTLPTGVASLTCTRYSTEEPTASTGTVSSGSPIYYGDVIYWTATASTGYNVSVSHGSSNKVTVTGNINGASNAGLSVSVKSYTLTISVTNESYGSYSVSRTSSPLAGAATGALSNGSTIYYGDVLTGSHSKNADSPISWNAWPTVTAPSATTTGDATSGNLTVKNEDSTTCTLYYNSTNSTSGATSLGSAAAGATKYKDGLSFDTTYYIFATKTITRTGSHYTYTDNSTYNGTSSVTGNVTASFSFSRNSVSDSESKTGYSSIVSKATAARNLYTITWKYRDDYDSWTTTTQSYYWGETPSAPVTPGTVTTGSYITGLYRRVPTNWDNLGVVTGARTITMGYVDEWYAQISGTRCTANKSTGWYSSSFTCTWTASSSCAFSTSGTNTTSQTISDAGYYSKSADWIYVTISGTHCTADKSTGWNLIGSMCTWEREWGYAFDSSGTTTTTDNLSTPGATYSKSCTYGYWTVNYSYCTPNDYGGWKLLSGNPYSVTFTASSGYAFNSSGSSTYTVNNITVPATTEGTANYVAITFSGTRCFGPSAVGYYAISSTATSATFTADSYCSFASGTTRQETSSVSFTPDQPKTVTASADYIAAASITGTRSTANRSSSRFYEIGTTITWTATAPWAFNSAGTRITTTATLDTPGGNYSQSADYGRRYNITYDIASDVSANWTARDDTYKYPNYGETTQTIIRFGELAVSSTIITNVTASYTVSGTDYTPSRSGSSGSYTYTRAATTSPLLYGNMTFTITYAAPTCQTLAMQTKCNTACSTSVSGAICNTRCTTQADAYTCPSCSTSSSASSLVTGKC